jgi:hypothetical protein
MRHGTSGTSVVPPSVPLSRAVPDKAAASLSQGAANSGIEWTSPAKAPVSWPDSQSTRASPVSWLPWARSSKRGTSAVAASSTRSAEATAAAPLGSTSADDSARPCTRGASSVPATSSVNAIGPCTSSSDAETSMPARRAAAAVRPTSVTWTSSGPVRSARVASSMNGQRSVPEARTPSSMVWSWSTTQRSRSSTALQPPAAAMRSRRDNASLRPLAVIANGASGPARVSVNDPSCHAANGNGSRS